MKFSLNFSIIIILLGCAIGNLLAQKTGARELVDIDLLDAYHIGFFRESMELPTLLLNGAENGEIDLFYFENFTKAPVQISFDNFMDSLKDPTADYGEWDVEFPYYEEEIISHNDNLYLSLYMEENIGVEPGTNPNYWEPLGSFYYEFHDFTSVTIDRQYFHSKYHIQYLHFYLSGNRIEELEEDKYMFSVRGNDAITLLNNSECLWYYRSDTNLDTEQNSGIMGHLAGDVFLLNWQFDALGSMVDGGITAFHNSTDSLFNYETGEFRDVTLPYSYDDDGSMDSIFIDYKVHANGGYDSIAVADMKHFLTTKTEFLKLGDALALEKYDGYQYVPEVAYYSLKSEMPQVGKPPKLVQVNVVERVNFQLSTNRRFKKELNVFVTDIIQGVRSNELRMFEANYIADDTTKTWIATDMAFTKPSDHLEENFIEEYNENEFYFAQEIVIFEGERFISLIDDIVGISPSEGPKLWALFSNYKELYYSQEVLLLDVHYELKFTDKGKILSKQPKYLTFVVPSEYTYEGVNMTMGSISVNELLNYKQSNNITHWDSFFERIENQHSFKFRMLEFGSLKVANK